MNPRGRISAFALVLFLAAGIGTSSPALAEWMFSHGNVAVIEYPANCTYKNFGWGVDMQQKPGMGNWVHMTVPTKYAAGIGARYVRLKFYTGSADAFVTQVDLFNGNLKVKEFKNLSLSNGWKDVQLDLGAEVPFNRGLGISILLGAGVESMSHRFIFSSAGALFQ